MSDIAIRVDHLSKRYKIGVLRNAHDTLRDQITDSLKAIFTRNGRCLIEEHRLVSQKSSASETLWALKDVSFIVKPGEVVGIVGKNGAGKSTLLKILSRITKPTEGRVEIFGRIGSLLEVGTGFHPELSGRENIYLNGTILGMRKDEIQRKFDEIVAFSEIDKFLDTPVKRYSSGMYVRLAFAVAAHLDLETMIIDEVLAVGDAEFQKKCLGKMGSVANTGRTVIFVSHNVGAVSKLCKRVIWMDGGQIALDGPVGGALSAYQAHNVTTIAEWNRSPSMKDSEEFGFLNIRVTRADGQISTVFQGNDSIVVTLGYAVYRSLPAFEICACISDSSGAAIFSTVDVDYSGIAGPPRGPGCYRATFTIPNNLLAPGRYFLFLEAHWPYRKTYELIEQAVVFDVLASGSLASDGRKGVVSPLIRWETSRGVGGDSHNVRSVSA